MIKYPNRTVQIETKNVFFLRGYHFHDSEKITFDSADIFYTRQNITKDIALGADAGLFYLQKDGITRYNGMRYGASLFWKHFIFRAGVNKFDDFSEFVPTIGYENNYKNHNYSIEYTHQNSLFYTYSLCSYKKRISADHFSLSDYISFQNKKNLWTNLTVNKFNNGDTEITGQFDWRFYYSKPYQKRFNYDLALEGWYTSHTKQHSCFYSPSFADTTILRIDPQYIFSKYIGIQAKAGLGYSFKDNSQAYKFGLWFFGNPQKKLSYSLGCLRSNSARISASSSYNYQECKVDLGYSW